MAFTPCRSVGRRQNSFILTAANMTYFHQNGVCLISVAFTSVKDSICGEGCDAEVGTRIIQAQTWPDRTNLASVGRGRFQGDKMSIRLSQEDFDKLTGILSQHSEWQNTQGRSDFLADVFAGSPRRADILTQLNLEGNPRGTAIRVIQKLADFGQDEAGREVLGILINKLLAYIGGGAEADYLRDLFSRYPFTTQPVASRGVAGWHGKETEGGVAEKIIGENTLRDIYVLEVLLDSARAVVRINGPDGLGTGFLIADNLLITNNHVIGDAKCAAKCSFEFNYQLNRKGVALPIRTAKFAKRGLFYTSAMADSNANAAELDYTVVQLTDVPKDVSPLTLGAAPIPRDSRLVIIQHPGGDYKKISLQNNFVEYVDEFVVQYTTSTEPGSSGSPVINESFEIVAIHHAGGNLSEPATKRRYLRNEGIRASAILNDLKKNAPKIYQRAAR